jgi:hypothetical protein
MDNTKYGKYFITTFGEMKQKNPWARSLERKDETPLLRIDQDVINGIACFARCNWFWPSIVKNKLEVRSTKPHSHTYEEIIGMVGTNFDDPSDLGGEMRSIGGKNIL